MTIFNPSFEIADGGDPRLPANWMGGGNNGALDIADFGGNRTGVEDFESGWIGGTFLVVFDPAWPAASFATAHGPKPYEPFDAWSDWFAVFPSAAAAVFTSYPIAPVETFEAGWQNNNYVVPFEVFPVGFDLTAAGHPFVGGEPVTLSASGALPTPLALATTYWIQVDDADNVILLDAPMGSSVGPITDVGSGTYAIIYNGFPFSWTDGTPFSTAALFDGGADAAEDFEGGWLNDTYPTSWPSSTNAVFGPGGISSENFESVLAPNIFTVDPATDLLTTSRPHGLSLGSKVTVALDDSAASQNLVGLLPGGLQPVVTYFAVVTGASTLQLTLGGSSVVDITDTGAGVYVLLGDPTVYWTTLLGI